MRYTQRPSSRRQESMWVWVPLLLLLCWAHRAFSRCSYPCVEQGLGWRAFLSFPAPPSAFSSPCPLVTQKGSLCCFPRGNSSLRSMFVAWSASILGSLCLSGPRGRFVSMLRCASVICLRLPLLPRVSRPLLETDGEYWAHQGCLSPTSVEGFSPGDWSLLYPESQVFLPSSKDRGLLLLCLSQN